MSTKRPKAMKASASDQPAAKKAKKPAPPASKTAKKTAKKKVPAAKVKTAAVETEIWNLRLYVAGQTPRSLTAFSNLKKICEQHLPGRYEIEVVDLMKNPQLAHSDQIVALPTLVRKLPEPIKRVIGDLSNIEKVMVGIDMESGPAK